MKKCSDWMHQRKTKYGAKQHDRDAPKSEDIGEAPQLSRFSQRFEFG
jgi:hypothetical protein